MAALAVAEKNIRMACLPDVAAMRRFEMIGVLETLRESSLFMFQHQPRNRWLYDGILH